MVVAVSANHPVLQPAHAVTAVNLRTPSGDRGDRWMLRLDESSTEGSLNRSLRRSVTSADRLPAERVASRRGNVALLM
jgi:hypothetical protein